MHVFNTRPDTMNLIVLGYIHYIYVFTLNCILRVVDNKNKNVIYGHKR